MNNFSKKARSQNGAKFLHALFFVFLGFFGFQAANAATLVSGVISTDTVWTKANSPYVIDDYLEISEDATLTIEPGVVVKFNQSNFAVYGEIVALGSEQEKIYFTSIFDDSVGDDTNGDGVATTPTQGDWGGIYFANALSDLAVENAEVRYSRSLYFDSVDANLRRVDFENNGSIYFDSATGDFNNVNFKNNDTVYFDSSLMNLNESDFGNNRLLYIDGGYAKIDDSNIKDSEYGIIVDQSSFHLTNSKVSGAYGWRAAGITSWSALELNIVGNVINGNYGDGIYLESASTTISDNLIFGNNGSGIYIATSIPENISRNDIYDNGDFGIYNETDSEVDAKNNWWGDESGPYHPILNPDGEGDAVSDNVIFIPWLKASIEKPSGFSNVAFIPGIEASRLYRQGLLLENQLWEPNRNDDAKKLFLDKDGKSVDLGIYTRDIIKETNTPFPTGSLGLNIYKKFSESMDKMVSDGEIKEWRALPYDWRFDLSDIVSGGVKDANGNISYIKMKPAGQLSYMISELEELAKNSNNGKVTIITHSNGGLVAKALIKKLAEMKELGESDLLDKIDRLIMVAAPQIGTPQAIAGMLHGDGQDLGLGFILSKSVARDLAENMPGAYNLLPSEKYFETVLDPAIKFDESVDNVNAWRSVYGNFITDFQKMSDFILGKEGRTKPLSDDTATPNVLNGKLLNTSENNHNSLDEWQIPASIEVSQIAGWGLDTMSGIEYYAKMECVPVALPDPLTGDTCENKYVLDRRPIFTSDGDETVVAPSATASEGKSYYLDIAKYNQEVYIPTAHKNIFEIQPLEDLLKNIITNSTTTLSSYITYAKPESESKKLRLSVHSPVSIDVYDSLGNHTGIIANSAPDSDLELIEENIPNSYYLNFGEGKYVGFDSDTQKRIELKGSGAGTFTLEIGEYLDNKEATGTAFTDIPVTSAMKGELNIQNLDSAPQLKIDVEGDGTFDFEIKPSDEFDPILFLEIMKKTVQTFNLKKNIEKNLIKRMDNLIKSIKKGKIRQAEKKLKGFIKKIESKKKHNKKIGAEEKEAILNMLNQLLNNF